MSTSEALRLVGRIVGIWLALNLTPAYAAATPAAKKTAKAKPKAVAKAKAAPARLATVNYYSIAQAPAAPPRLAAAASAAAAPSAVLTAPVAKEDDVVKRILNFRIHPVYLVQMMTDRTTIGAGRADLDFVLGDKFTLGPSVIFQKSTVQDNAALANGIGQSLDDTRWDIGLLANIYLTGTTSTGGFILRPHVYWVDVNGQKDPGAGGAAIIPTSTQNGARAGAELVFQKILGNGFNFEVGGGFTYYLVPYQLNYNDGGQATDGPDNRFSPTITLGIGWAF